MAPIWKSASDPVPHRSGDDRRALLVSRGDHLGEVSPAPRGHLPSAPSPTRGHLYFRKKREALLPHQAARRLNLAPVTDAESNAALLNISPRPTYPVHRGVSCGPARCSLRPVYG